MKLMREPLKDVRPYVSICSPRGLLPGSEALPAGLGATVWPQGTKGGSALIIFLPFPNEMSWSGNFSQKMALSYILEGCQIDFRSIVETRDI